MARKVTKAQLLKKAARLKIKGRSTMSKAELEKAVSPSSRRQTPGSNKKARGGTNIALDRQRRARKPGKRIPRGGGAPYYERRANRSDRGQLLGNSYAQLSGVDKLVVSLCKNPYFRELMGVNTTIREIVNYGGWYKLEELVDNGFENLAIDQANGEATEVISVIQAQVMDKADFHDLAEYFEGTNL
jgi:hypothetical protein